MTTPHFFDRKGIPSWLPLIPLILLLLAGPADPVDGAGADPTPKSGGMMTEPSPETIKDRLTAHLKTLTETIGERSVERGDGLDRAADYISETFGSMGIAVHRETYRFMGRPVHNLVTEIPLSDAPARRYLLGAHYDTVVDTPGADDNASAVAVALETARRLKELVDEGGPLPPVSVSVVAFTLEEPPAYGTGRMGSRVHARRARERGDRIDGMICLEMVGYTCGRPGCQDYPFPLGLRDYPDSGTFIGIVGNLASRSLTSGLDRAFDRVPDLPTITLSVPFNGKILPAVRLSDHASFWDEGYPAVMVTDTSFYRNPNYHLPTDTMDTLDLDFMAALVKGLARFFTQTEP
jgi:hypothetical protein